MSCAHREKTERIKSCPDPDTCEKNHPNVVVKCADCGFKIGEMA